MSRAMPFQYVVLRCVPRADREEFLNIGVVLHCQAADYLRARHHVDPDRLTVLGRGLDVAAVHSAMAAVDAVCRGEAPGGADQQSGLGTRFGFLAAPRSTVVRPGPVHGGLTRDPDAELSHLLERLVR